jgi:hypothetical protein
MFKIFNGNAIAAFAHYLACMLGEEEEEEEEDELGSLDFLNFSTQSALNNFFFFFAKSHGKF